MNAPADWMKPAMACPALSLQGLRLRAGSRSLAEGLDLTIRAGELWCVVGPNGVGKSTLMGVMAGLRPPDGGAVTLDAQPLARIAPAALALRRALLPQAVHDTFSMRVRDAVAVGRHPHLSGWGWSGGRDDAVVTAVMHELDLDALAERDVLTLSGGERQRVSLAAMLAQQAPLMLLDEPLAHLDLRHQIMVLETLSRMARAGHHAIVLILHDLNLARRYATHALLMSEDTHCLHGPAAQVLTPAHCSRALRTPVVSVSDGAHTALIANGATSTDTGIPS
jgi:iron complex transport system ATP-binding protein